MRSALAAVTLLACVHAGLWYVGKSQLSAPDFNGQFPSLSYTPSDGHTRPDKAARPVSAEQIRADMRLLAPYTRGVRTYSATDGADRSAKITAPDGASLVPGIANEFGLKVTAGAWLGTDAKRNEREVLAAIDLARKHSNIDGIVVGNETVYRGETVLVGDDKLNLTPDELSRLSDAKATGDAKELERVQESINVNRLIKIIQRVKRETQVPVTTGEIWSVWQDHPELVSAVDFIAVHILPYWEGKPGTAAVDEAIGAL